MEGSREKETTILTPKKKRAMAAKAFDAAFDKTANDSRPLRNHCYEWMLKQRREHFIPAWDSFVGSEEGKAFMLRNGKHFVLIMQAFNYGFQAGKVASNPDSKTSPPPCPDSGHG